ncbi:DUF3618 domain-containing protein [Novosphingobium lubricantis]|jgi:hypothetical protein
MSSAQAIAEAKALRDEALAIVRADIELARSESSPSRMRERAVGEAVEMLDTVRDVAGENKAVIGVVLAALFAWFFRGSLLNLVRRTRDAA